MPELPEVETIARQLDKALKGQSIVGVEVKREKSFPHFAKATRGKKGIVGRRILKVRRRAKMVVVEIATSQKPLATSYLLIHLKMTGQLVYQETRNKKQETNRIVGGHPTADWVAKLPSSHTRVVVELNKGRLFFNDQRVFGWVKVMDKQGLKKEFKNYGPDMIDRQVTKEYFYQTLHKSRRAVKLVICDQKDVAGVGNIYANDGLWCAGVDPRRPAKEIVRSESDKLWACLRQVLKQGIKYGGATASDDKFVQATGLGGKYQEHFLAYERDGQKCRRRGCGGVMRKIRLGGRGTYYCPRCQR